VDSYDVKIRYSLRPMT